VELGAVAVVPAGEDLIPAAYKNPRPLYSSRMPILGNDILHPWMERVRKLGMKSLWLTSGPHDGSVPGSALARLARQGVERLLVINLKSYAEMDLVDLLRFHCERRNSVTEAHDARGQLGVCLLDHLDLHATGRKFGSPYAPADCARNPYQFHGYAKRILSASERQELVRDALTEACAMRPLGTQIRQQVWIGEGVSLADSVRVIGPAYIGARTTICAGATVGPFASVERDCVVDCGTTVERSTVLPHTYLAPGLLIRDGIVDGGHLEDLGWGAVADLEPARLGGRIRRREPRKPAFSETKADILSGADAFASKCAPSSIESQPWLQVQL
jgi:carbonic anhydrase/acetyltransferase-like protein (isoleucine patch superfamily)